MCAGHTWGCQVGVRGIRRSGGAAVLPGAQGRGVTTALSRDSSHSVTCDSHQVANVSVAFEADLGVFLPLVTPTTTARPSFFTTAVSLIALFTQGLEFTGPPMAVSIMQEIMLLAAPLNATQVIPGGSNVDSGPWGAAGVPYGAPMIANQV